MPIYWSVQLPEGQAIVRRNTSLVTQKTDKGTLINAGILPPYSIVPLSFSSAASSSHNNGLSISSTHLENQYLYVALNEAGDITSIYDKANQREVLAPGTVANQLQFFEDRPIDWDAWDIDIYYEDKIMLAGPASVIDVVETGPLRAALRIERRVLSSTITQTISLFHNQPQLDLNTHVDWRERHILMKVAFPVDIHSPTATYEIQWGNVERPTHRNTSWDWARFETCAHKWIDWWIIKKTLNTMVTKSKFPLSLLKL